MLHTRCRLGLNRQLPDNPSLDLKRRPVKWYKRRQCRNNIPNIMQLIWKRSQIETKRVVDRNALRTSKVSGRNGSSNRVACLTTFSFLDAKKYSNVKDHIPPLFISGIFKNKPITWVMVDNRSAVNIIPRLTLLLVGPTDAHLKHTNMVI